MGDLTITAFALPLSNLQRGEPRGPRERLPYSIRALLLFFFFGEVDAHRLFVNEAPDALCR